MSTLLRLIRFLRPMLGWVALSVLLGVGTVAAGIGLLGTSAYLIAMAALRPSIAVLQVAVVGVRFFGISRGILRYLERLVSHSVNFRLLAGLRVWFYRSMEPLAPAGLQSLRSGDLLSRSVADIAALENFYVRVVSPPVIAFVVTLGVGWLVGLVHWGFSLILLAGLLVNGLFLPWTAYAAGRQPGQTSVAARSALSAALIDALQGAADLLAFGQASMFIERIYSLAQEVAVAQTGLARRGAAAAAIQLLVSNLTLWFVLLLGIALAGADALHGVTLAVLVLITLASFEAVQPLGQAALHLEASLQSGRRIFALADQKPVAFEPDQPVSPPQDTTVNLRGVCFGYPGGQTTVLDGIELQLSAGERVALTGASGSGKTTLLHLLCGFWQPSSGEICLGGVPLAHLAGVDLRRRITLMSQQVYLFSATLRQNLLLANPSAGDAELLRALEQAALLEWVRGLPEGLDTWIGERGQKMSGGERQRLAIARLLLQNTPIVLLDEPTSHLDALTAHQVRQKLLEVTRGKAVIWITHQADEWGLFDRVLRLEDGRLSQIRP